MSSKNKVLMDVYYDFLEEERQALEEELMNEKLKKFEEECRLALLSMNWCDQLAEDQLAMEENASDEEAYLHRKHRKSIRKGKGKSYHYDPYYPFVQHSNNKRCRRAANIPMRGKGYKHTFFSY